jgi:hypothetical protein
LQIRKQTWIGCCLPLCVGLLLASSSLLVAQEGAIGRDSARVLLLEHRFGPDSAGTIVVRLERRVAYWVEVTGPGTPEFEPIRRRPLAAFLVPIAEGQGDHPRRFELYAVQAGPHQVSLSDLPPGTSATLRLYRDVLETRRIAEKRDREFSVGLVVAVGFHSGYRLDPTGGANPAGGGDAEGCLVAETGNRFGTCIGVERQTFPDAGFTATWLFVEQRARLVSTSVVGRRTDLGAALRYSQALSAGPRHLNPGLLGFGLYLRQYLEPDGHRRGSSIFCAWQHGRLGNAPETERVDTDRLRVGFTWMP